MKRDDAQKIEIKFLKKIIEYIRNKKVKKHNLQNIFQIENTTVPNILYKFNDSIFITLDANGYINYYSDSMEIYDLHSIVNFIEQEHPNSNKTYLFPLPETFDEPAEGVAQAGTPPDTESTCDVLPIPKRAGVLAPDA